MSSEVRLSVVSLFATELQSVPERREYATFAELVALIGAPRTVASKRGIPMFSPAEWTPGERKTKTNVERVHFGVLDLDDLTEDELASVLAPLEHPYLLASSWSHGVKPGLFRARLVVPFTRAVEVREWPAFHAAFARVVGRGLADPACKDPNRCFWVPAHPENPPAEPIYVVSHEGEPLDVDTMLALGAPRGASSAAQPSPPSPPRPAPANAHGAVADYLRSAAPATPPPPGAPAQHQVTIADLRELSRKKSRSSSAKTKELGNALRAICDGESFADEGNRDNMLYRVCATLAEAWPYADAEKLAALLAPSLDAMGVDGPSVADALEKIERKRAEPRAALSGKVGEYFRGLRDAPYTEEELDAFTRQHGLDVREQIRARWIVQRGRSYYLWGGILEQDGVCREGRYRGPFSSDDMQNAARKVLAAAAPAGVTLDVVTERGTRPKTSVELVRDYGTVAEKQVADLAADFSYYDDETDTFVEAPCPLRDLTPRRDERIERWLSLLAGPAQEERLRAWIAAVTLLREPCAALYLEGSKAVGKTLLAVGLSRLWTTRGPTTLDELLASFNESLLSCPLVLGDEVAPVDFRGRARTSELREAIQARVRPLKRKYVATSSVLGCVRIVMCANNRELLNSTGHETNRDIGAIVERIYYLSAGDLAAPYLASLPRSVVESWVEEDLIARHALYLRESVPIERTSRFLVSGEASELTRSLTVGTGIRSAVCHWLVSFLLEPDKLSQINDRDLIRVHDGDLVVNSRILHEHWSSYATHVEPPTITTLSQAIAGISTGERLHLRDHRQREVWYRRIDTENLITWAESTGYATAETIRSSLAASAGRRRRQDAAE